MKTYVTEQQLRLVGKGWEIRKYLKKTLERVSCDVPLSAFLDGTSPDAFPQGKRIIRSAAAAAGKLSKPMYLRQPRMQSQR